MSENITNHEAVQMMGRCNSEIRMLRAQIAELQPKAEAYDNMAALIRLLPKPGMMSSEDLCWTLEQRMRELTPAPVNPSSPAED